MSDIIYVCPRCHHDMDYERGEAETYDQPGEAEGSRCSRCGLWADKWGEWDRQQDDERTLFDKLRDAIDPFDYDEALSLVDEIESEYEWVRKELREQAPHIETPDEFQRNLPW